MSKYFIAILLALLIAGCSQDNTPPQAKAWCQYNAFENRLWRENSDIWNAAHPGKNIIPMADQEAMHKDAEPRLKAERDNLFGQISDEQFIMIQGRADKEDWFKNYCGG